MMPTLSSLAAPPFVIVTTSAAISDGLVGVFSRSVDQMDFMLFWDNASVLRLYVKRRVFDPVPQVPSGVGDMQVIN